MTWFFDYFFFGLFQKTTPTPKEVPEMDHFKEAVRLAKKRWNIEILDDQILPTGKWKGADKAEISLIVKQGGGDFWFNWMVEKYGGYVDRKVQFCGFFVGSCFPTLAPSIRKYVIASCYRLANNWDATGFEKPEFVDPKDIRAGDIVTKNATRSNSHMMLAESSVDADGNFETYEANSYGYTPFWTRAKCLTFPSKYHKGVEGVIRQTRNIDDVYMVIRLTPEMLLG